MEISVNRMKTRKKSEEARFYTTPETFTSILSEKNGRG